MPPCPCARTAGTLATCVFCPCCVTNQTGPTFSVTSIRPSGRKAIRHGSVKVATVVMLNGRPASGFCSPALTWADAVDDTSAASNTPIADFIPMLLRSDSHQDRFRFCVSPQVRSILGGVMAVKTQDRVTDLGL